MGRPPPCHCTRMCDHTYDASVVGLFWRTALVESEKRRVEQKRRFDERFDEVTHFFDFLNLS